MKIRHLALSLVLFAVGCGSVEEQSSLKAPPVMVYRFNGTGGEGLQGAWVVPTADCAPPRDQPFICSVAKVGGPYATIGLGARGDKVLIDGPMGFNLSTSASGYVNVSAEVAYDVDWDMAIMGPMQPASVTAELVYGDVNNPTVIGSTVITFAGKKDITGPAQTASIPGRAFPHSINDVRVRIRNYQPLTPIGVIPMHGAIHIQETRIIYN